MRLVDKIILVHPNTEWTLDGDEYANLVFLDGTIKLDEETFNSLVELKVLEIEEKNRLELEAKATAKSALLSRLGITEDEAKLLLS